MALQVVGTRSGFTVLGCSCGGSFVVQEDKPAKFCAYCGGSWSSNVEVQK